VRQILNDLIAFYKQELLRSCYRSLLRTYYLHIDLVDHYFRINNRTILL